MTDLKNKDLISFLEAVEIKPFKDCINITYDSQGFLYEIPNYCIHYPSIYELKSTEKPIQPMEEIINVIIRNQSTTINIEILNTVLISQLKEIVCERVKQTDENLNLEAGKMRMFFGGKELNDDKEIWAYNIKENSIILFLFKSD